MISLTNVILLSMLIAFLAFSVGWIWAKNHNRRKAPTEQEQVDAILQSASPATVDDLMRLMAEGCIYTMDRLTTYNERKYRDLNHLSWQFRIQVGETTIRTPERHNFVELLCDVPQFESQVAALKGSQTLLPVDQT